VPRDGSGAADLTALRRRVEAVETETSRTSVALAERLRDLEARLDAVQAAGADDAEAREALAALRDGVRSLQADLRSEFGVVAARLDWLEARLVGVAGPGAGEVEALSEEEEKELAILARDADDAGVRFSALVLLGLRRTSRSVQASVERLEDERDFVVWQALRNLGRFKETAAASVVAERLEHEKPTVRAAASEALTAMGAPDAGFDPNAPAADRAEAVAVLRAWAEARE
jgi:HEAT repeat protein